MVTQEADRARPRSASGGLSRLWIGALLLGVVVSSVIAALQAGALPSLAATAALALTIPAFFGASFAAMRRDPKSVRKAASHWVPPEDGPIPDDGDRPASELDQVRSWRTARLERLGVPPELSTTLAADAALSVHELERLLAAGCPLATALRILEPD